MELPGAILSQNWKNEKNRSEKISYIFSKKSFSYISVNGTLLCFLRKVFLIPRETKLSYISGSNFPGSEK